MKLNANLWKVCFGIYSIIDMKINIYLGISHLNVDFLL